MRCEDIWITAVAADYGTLVPIDEAVQAGHLTSSNAARSGMLSTAIANEPINDMVVRCGTEVLAAGEPTPIGHIHASGLPQGPPLWSVAPYLWGRLRPQDRDGFAGLSTSVASACNGSTVALENAARSVALGLGPILVTASDSFGDPGAYGPDSAHPVDRYRGDLGLTLGDGAGAAIVGAGGGVVKIEAIAGFTVPALEVLQRGADDPGPHCWPSSVAIADRTRTALNSVIGIDDARALQHRGVTAVVNQVLTEAHWEQDSVRWFIPPFVGTGILQAGYLAPLQISPEQTLAHLGVRTGHLGAADHLIALDHLLKQRLIRAGDRVILLGVGAGFTFVAVAIEAHNTARRPREAH